MDLAIGPGKALAMSTFMLYMSGSALNMWTINMVSGALTTPLKGIASINTVFERLYDRSEGSKEELDLTLAKLVFIGCNLLGLAIGVYKMIGMGLFPSTSGDFVQYVVWKDEVEGGV